MDLSHDNNSGQTYTINEVTGLSYSTSTYPDLKRGGQASRGGGRTLTIPCLRECGYLMSDRWRYRIHQG